MKTFFCGRVKFLDLLIVAGIIAVGIILTFFFLIQGSARVGDIVVLTYNESEHVYPLGVDAVITPDVDYSITVVIRGSEVWIDHTECPGRDCQKMGRIARVGERIVCIPAGLIVAVEGDPHGEEREQTAPDVVVG